MTELTVKKAELRVREKRNAETPTWEVVSVTMYSDGTVSRTVLCERDSFEKAMELIQTDYIKPEGITTEMVQAAQKAHDYDFKALYDRWPTMSPVEVIAECKEVLRIYDTLQQTPEPLGLDSLNSDGFMESMLFLEAFCMRYLVDIFFNGQ